MIKFCISIVAVFSMTFTLARAAEIAPGKPAESDKCPVCGMFVARYPDFFAQVVFKDGSYASFCGVKDMMKYHFDLPKYSPSKKTSDISRIIVTDYFDMKPTDGFQAYYVVGSTVFGPMGQEFIPFAEESAAKDFLRENKGKEILRFDNIDAETFKELLRKY